MLREIVGAIAAFVVGFLVARWRYRAPARVGLALPAPLNDDEYRQNRAFYIDMYRASMQQYDKLVPWAAGGALVLSMTLLHDVATATGSIGPRVVLGLAWSFLFLSLVGSIASHFTSSRVYSSARAALDLVHRGDAKEAAQRAQAAADHNRIVAANSRITYWLNYASGGALLVGLGLLGAWAFLSLFK